jgi:putative transposase
MPTPKARQLALGLRSAPRWGGRREGAGRRPGPNPRDPHRRRSPLAARFPCHVTLRIRRGIPSLRKAGLVREWKRSLRQGCERGCFRVVHYSLQRDHVHLLVEAANARDLACGMKSIGARLARAVHRSFRSRGPVLADRYHLHVLKTPREVRNALAYVLLNARKHWRERHGIAPPARLDPASSAACFDGWRATGPPLAEVHVTPEAAEVARPRTWLLRAGWQRHGLIDPAEVPKVGRRRTATW